MSLRPLLCTSYFFSLGASCDITNLISISLAPCDHHSRSRSLPPLTPPSEGFSPGGSVVYHGQRVKWSRRGLHLWRFVLRLV